MKRPLLTIGMIVVCLSVALGGGALAQGTPDLSGVACLECHDNPTVKGVVQVWWKETAHPAALETLKASPQAGDACLACHSADYVLAPAGARPSMGTATLGVTCLACHPGDHRLNVSSDIKDIYATCTKCHSQGTALTAGEAAHHPVLEMFGGQGAPGVPATPSEHAGATDCIKCHREGHKFSVAQRACNGCHEGKIVLKDAQAGVSASLVRLKADLERIEASHAGWDVAASGKGADQLAYEQAFTLYTFVASDGSQGVHNVRYSRVILEQASTTLSQAGLLAPAALPASGGRWPARVDLLLACAGLLVLTLGLCARRGAH